MCATERAEPARGHERDGVQRDHRVPGHHALQVQRVPLALRRQGRHIRHRRHYHQVSLDAFLFLFFFKLI